MPDTIPAKFFEGDNPIRAWLNIVRFIHGRYFYMEIRLGRKLNLRSQKGDFNTLQKEFEFITKHLVHSGHKRFCTCRCPCLGIRYGSIGSGFFIFWWNFSSGKVTFDVLGDGKKFFHIVVSRSIASLIDGLCKFFQIITHRISFRVTRRF